MRQCLHPYSAHDAHNHIMSGNEVDRQWFWVLGGALVGAAVACLGISVYDTVTNPRIVSDGQYVFLLVVIGPPGAIIGAITGFLLAKFAFRGAGRR